MGLYASGNNGLGKLSKVQTKIFDRLVIREPKL